LFKRQVARRRSEGYDAGTCVVLVEWIYGVTHSGTLRQCASS